MEGLAVGFTDASVAAPSTINPYHSLGPDLLGADLFGYTIRTALQQPAVHKLGRQ